MDLRVVGTEEAPAPVSLDSNAYSEALQSLMEALVSVCWLLSCLLLLVVSPSLSLSLSL